MHPLPTIRGVNWLYLITMLLIVIVGSAMQANSPILGLIATEWLLILPSALIFLRIVKLPVVQTMRVRWPGGKIAGLVTIIGFGLSLFTLWLGVIITTLFGYSFGLPPGLYPQNGTQAVLLFFAMAISAPICEESLFRGVIQRGYERYGPLIGILIGGILFTVYHLSFQRLIILLPIAITLGYAAWRTNSLISSILVHASYNTVASILTIITSFRPDLPLDFFGSLPGAIVGLVMAAAGLFLLRQVTSPEIETQEPEKSPWLSRSVPLTLAIFIFLFLGGTEFVLGRFPQALANNPITLSSAPWQTPVTWNYELRDVLDETVGEAQCSLSLDQNYLLDCQIQQNAFKAQKGQSYYQSGAYDASLTARWTSSDLQLLEANGSWRGAGVNQKTSLQQAGKGLILSTAQDNKSAQTLELSANALLMGEWPWRLSALPWQIGYVAKVSLAWPSHYSQEAKSSIPALNETVVNVRGAEPLATPAGNFIAWKVTMGDQTAWYNTQPPHTLLRYDDGTVSYLLTNSQ
jgi:membrane protease YdiL (CAAX protease family)